MNSFPAFFPLAGKRVVIAGADAAAEVKARLFAGSPASLVRLRGEEAFEPGAYAGAALVFVASFEPVFRERAAAAARQAGPPVNVTDRPDLCDFYAPAIVDRGALVAAVGSSGAAPLIASQARGELEQRLPEGLGRWVALLGERRAAIRQAFPELGRRRAFLRRLLAGLSDTEGFDTAEAAGRIDAAISAAETATGAIAFIVVPAAPDLLSLRAARALGAADVVVVADADRAVIERHARREAEFWSADLGDEPIGKRADAGERVAIVGAEPSARRLKALGARRRVEVLRPAPA